MALQRFSPLFMRAKAAFPAVAFFGGFLWDAVTLGRSIQPLDLFILLGYLLAAGGILIWMGRRGAMRGPSSEPHGGSGHPVPDLGTAGSAAGRQASSGPEGESAPSTAGKILTWLREDGPAFALQFCFGSIFSCLVIFYFLSSSYLPGFLVVLLLVALLVLNEFLESHYHRFTITWTLYGICAILYFNFALPHLVHSIHAIWFFLSTAAGVGLIYGLKALSPKAQGSTWPILAAAGTLVLLYLCNAIPPVPLVKKNIAICRNLEHTEGRYQAEMQKLPFYSSWRHSEPVVRQRNGEKVFCFTSVFLPTGIQCTLYHRWLYDDPRKKEWVETSHIGFPISGGRKDGFRGYTYKRNLSPGRWEVRVETESGRVLGTIHFRAEASADSTMEFKKLILE
ncbi:MAG: conserved rane protein of unknown function [Fibrobacteres bacterium]|nr:conserved rane protein of unknown function [Fibrobacterota bacterium]